jgi:4-carboxymuconolactone decarboxylase
MERFRKLPRDEFDEEQVAAWDLVRQTWGGEAGEEPGDLTGPFSVVIHAPALVPRLMELGKTLRGSSVPERAVELIIITVGARWKAEFEWWMHVDRAREEGVAESVIEAIGAGRAPEFDNGADRIVHAITDQLLEAGQIDDSTFEAGREQLGDRGIVEIVSLCGYYTLIAFILNAFDVPLPGGVRRRWPARRQASDASG